MRSAALHAASLRVGALRGVFLLTFLALAARAAHLSIDERGEKQGDKQTSTTIRLEGTRGSIVDRAGVELAISVLAPSIYANPRHFENFDRSVAALAPALGTSRRKLAARLRGRTSFTYVARWVTPETAKRVTALDLSGVGVLREPGRAYPAASLAAHTIGFVNIDGEGIRGVEQQEDSWLRGSEIERPAERDARGHLLASSGVELAAAGGGDVALTIDAGFQTEAEQALRTAVRETGARGGIVLTLDPHTGEILALAEEPSFDPNRFRELDYNATRSRAFLDALEPGSTLKIFLIAAALEAGAVTETDTFDCSEGEIRVPGKTIRDPKPYGMLAPTDVLRLSSNVGAVQILMRLGPQAYHEALVRFGFGSSTQSGFPVESAGLLRPWRRWKPVDQATIAFGQGIGVTTVQLAAAAAVIANGGEWRAPKLIAARRKHGGGWRPTPARPARRVLSNDTAASVLRMMEAVVGPEGTGRRAGLRALRVAGKTGTAQKLDRDTGTYSRKRFVAWFIGVVPADAPRLVTVAALDEPRGEVTGGGAIAAPLFAQVAAGQLGRLGLITTPQPIPRPESVAPVSLASAASDASLPITSLAEYEPPSAPASKVVFVPASALASSAVFQPPSAPASNAVFVPNFQGLDLDDARRVAHENALVLEARGRGRAVAQEPAPGTIVRGARRVRVHFASIAASGEG